MERRARARDVLIDVVKIGIEDVRKSMRLNMAIFSKTSLRINVIGTLRTTIVEFAIVRIDKRLRNIMVKEK